jgi:hypothetical protein
VPHDVLVGNADGHENTYESEDEVGKGTRAETDEEKGQEQGDCLTLEHVLPGSTQSSTMNRKQAPLVRMKFWRYPLPQ